MNWKSFCLGIGAGIIGSFAAFEIYSKKMYLSSDKVLNQAKEFFKQSGPISGSWIMMEPEDYEKPPFNYKIYKGGVTRIVNGKTEPYEFIADAKTGTIIEINKLF